jgi:nucleotide-binding universal stress UspA family protein
VSEYSDDQLVDLLLGIKISCNIEEAVSHEPELRRRYASLSADLGDLESELPELLSGGVCSALARDNLRILLAIDGSRSRSEAALAALALAQLGDGVVDVLHVREARLCGRGCVVVESRDEARAVLDPTVTGFHSRGVMVRAQLRTAIASRVAEQILCEASEIAADIIVIGESSRSRLKGLWDPRVGAKVVKWAPCPVLVARPRR